MANQAEVTFVKNFIATISAQPVVYQDDYTQPPENFLKKVPVLQVPLPPPPKRKAESSTANASNISVTFKSLKPPQSYTLSVQPTDTISEIKSQLAAQRHAPPADAQRLLLKGKALADSKLLKEYNVKEGDIINLMVKPGFDWDPSKTSSVTDQAMDIDLPSSRLDAAESDTKLNAGHKQRIPSVILSPSPSGASLNSEMKPQDISLTLDTSAIPTASLSPQTRTSYQHTISQPAFWDRLYSFVRSEFPSEDDALLAFEEFLRASKGVLTANEIAKIRDHVGVVGMAGT